MKVFLLEDGNDNPIIAITKDSNNKVVYMSTILGDVRVDGEPQYDEKGELTHFIIDNKAYLVNNLIEFAKPLIQPCRNTRMRLINHLICDTTMTLKWEGNEIVTCDLEKINDNLDYLHANDIPFEYTIHRTTKF